MAAAAASVAVVMAMAVTAMPMAAMAMAAAAATMAMARRWWWCGVDGSNPDFGDVKYGDDESFGNGASSSAAGLRTHRATHDQLKAC